MTTLFITGLSGVGKSTVLTEMRNRGYQTVDLDYDYMTFMNNERLIDEVKMMNLLNQYKDEHLILAGTESNQGEFYKYFDEVILLTTDLDVMLERIHNRTNNNYGKNEAERTEIINNYNAVLPLLRKRASVVIDTTSKNINAICKQLEELL